MSETGASLKDTVKGTTVVFMGMVISTLVWFSTRILIIRNTSIAELGFYSVAVSIGGIFTALGGIGIQDGVSRFVAVFLGGKKRNAALSISASAIKAGLLSGSFLSLVLFLTAGIAAQKIFYKPELAPLLRIMSLFVLFSVTANILGGILRGHNVISPRVYLLDIGQPLFFLFSLGCVFFFRLPFPFILYSYVAAMLVVLILLCMTYEKRIGFPRRLETEDSSLVRELMRFSAPLLIANMLGFVLTWSDTIILGRYALAEDVGVYNVSVSLAKLLTFPIGALEFAYLPVAGDLYAKGRLLEIGDTYKVLTKWIFAATLPIFFILFFFPEMTITFFFGERFVGAATSLRILSAALLFHAFLGANGVLMIIMGRSKDLMNISIYGTLLNLMLNYVFIKHLGMGINGAALATLISYFGLNSVMSFILYRISGIHPFTVNYIKPILSSSIIGLFLYGIAKILPLSSLVLPLYLILFIVGYIISLVLTKSLDQEDIVMLEAISRKTGLRMEMVRRLFMIGKENSN
ncbi:MAG: flippase [Nitrospiraceae bacterium]|nr:flippase [Nitrospiraceae bacterium]